MSISYHSYSEAISSLPLHERKWIMAQVEAIVEYIAEEVAKNPTEVNAVLVIRDVLRDLEKKLHYRLRWQKGPWKGWFYVKVVLMRRGPHLLRYHLGRHGVGRLLKSSVREWMEHAQA